jgi:hypothetical protein
MGAGCSGAPRMVRITSRVVSSSAPRMPRGSFAAGGCAAFLAPLRHRSPSTPQTHATPFHTRPGPRRAHGHAARPARRPAGGGEQAGRHRHPPRRGVGAHRGDPPHRRRPARGRRVAGRAMGGGHQLRRADAGQLAHPHRPGPPRRHEGHWARRVPAPPRRRLPSQRAARGYGGDEPRRADRGPEPRYGGARPPHRRGGLAHALRVAGRAHDLHGQHRRRLGDGAGRDGPRPRPDGQGGAAHRGDRALAGRAAPLDREQPGQHRHRA